MKKLEKLENFKLENEKLVLIKGGGIETTGAGDYEMTNWPSQGYNTCVSYTSDTWDGETPGTMVRHGKTYHTFKQATTDIN